jgi:hypothetical protein
MRAATKPTSKESNVIMSSKKMTKRQQFDTWWENHREIAESQGSEFWARGENRKNYRETSEWASFVKRVKKDHCEVTGLKGKLTLHHLSEGEYSDLDPKKFVTVLWTVHRTIHQIDKKRDKSQVPSFWLQFCPSEWARKNTGP